MAKLTEYPSTSIFDKEDILILDGVNGTRKIKVKDAAKEFAGMISIVQNRNIYGGANLGNSVTDEQKTAIKNGTFKDLYVGDYWTIDGVNYRIADMDYWYRSGDVELLKHHLVIVPDTYFYATKMNETDITTGGYVGSKMRLENLEEAKSKIKAAFGELVLMRREYLVNAVTNGQSSSGAWFDSDVELMNEIMVYNLYPYTYEP